MFNNLAHKHPMRLPFAVLIHWIYLRIGLVVFPHIGSGLLSKSGDITDLNKAGKLSVLNNKVLDDQDIATLTYEEIKDRVLRSEEFRWWTGR